MDLGLQAKGVVVLAASAGLGLAVARGALAEGASVAICGRDRECLEHACWRARPMARPSAQSSVVVNAIRPGKRQAHQP